MPSFKHGDVEISYEIRGAGKPLLLVAGLASDRAFWFPVVDTLAARHQLILVDNRGSGQTSPLDVRSSIEAMAGDCIALVRHLRLPRVDLAGHSMGGMIAQRIAATEHALVDRLILAATVTQNPERNNDLFTTFATLFETADRGLWFRNLFYWVLSPRFFENRQQVDALVQLAATYPFQQSAVALRNQMGAIKAFDGRAALPAIRARTLVLAGAEDLLFSLASTTAMAHAIPRSTLSVMDGAAHSFPTEFPAEFTRHVLEFLAG
ncbi:MAG: alpha/beta hydrolase [Casimicrobiaceae bacterium]